MSWPNFLFGVAVGAIGAFFSGFLSKAGGDLYTWIKMRISNDQEFVEVDGRFNPSNDDGASLAWVPEQKLYQYKADGYSFQIIDGKKNGCFRKTSNGSRVYKEYLMKK